MSAIPADLRGPDVREWPLANGRLSALASQEVVELPRPPVVQTVEFGQDAEGSSDRAEYRELGRVSVPPAPTDSQPGPVHCRVKSLGLVDNDLRIRVNGAVVYDRRYIDPFWGQHYYDVPFSAPPGASVVVDVFDGGDVWRMSRCQLICSYLMPPQRARVATDILTIGVAAPNALSIGQWAHVAHGKVAAVAFTRLRVSGGRIYGVPCQGDGTTWQAAVAALRWRWSGLPWWNGAQIAALAGTPVARRSWTDPARTVRYIPGEGTSRAVAVDHTGNVLTAATFGEAEYLGDDWYLAGSTIAEPPEVDISGLTLAGGTTFAVVRSQQSLIEEPPTPGGGSDATPTGPTLPSTGSGVVYMRNGVVTLVPARRWDTQQTWTP